MAGGYSKKVTDRQKSSLSVVSTFETHADRIGEELASALGPHCAKGEKVPDGALLVRLLAKVLASRSERLVKADQEHEAELADDAEPRNARDTAASSVRETLVDLRAAVESSHGPGGLTKLGLSSAIPSDPRVLATLGANVQTSLEKVALGKPRRPGLELQPKVFAKELASRLPVLEAALTAVEREVREAQVTLAAKNEALEQSDKTFLRSAALVEALARFVGLIDVADRIRPSSRKPGRTEPDAAPPDEAQGPEGGD